MTDQHATRSRSGLRHDRDPDTGVRDRPPRPPRSPSRRHDRVAADAGRSSRIAAVRATVRSARPAPVGQRRRPAKRSRVRWAAAIAIVALWSSSRSAAAAFMLTGASPDATVLGYVPADSVVYGEVRLDLPGDQRAGRRRVPEQLPGLRRPGRPRHQARRGRSTGSSPTRPTTSRPSPRTSSPGSTARSPFAVGPLPGRRRHHRSRIRGRRQPRARAPLDQGRRRRAQAWFDERPDRRRARPSTTETYDGVDAHGLQRRRSMAGAKAAFGDHRRQGRRRR